MKVFYRSEQVARTESFSRSALKPRLVVEDWLSTRDIKSQIHIQAFEPATEAQIALAHDPAFVQAVLACEAPNGFGNASESVAASLPYTSGSMIAAARHAVDHAEVTCSPTSGFHHAGYRQAQGFCTFNGLMVTAMTLKAEGKVNKLGIIDCDVHYGNGTDDIIRKLGVDWIRHYTMGEVFSSRAEALKGRFERWLQIAIDRCQDCDLVLYQAGADPHIDDPLGGVLTTAQLAERDRMMFTGLGHKPMVWNLAGGYQVAAGTTDAETLAPVLELHRQTARLHCRVLG